ncbi:MAG TPA: hypothetical protein VN451_03605 [Chitinophagaceae bacterium]|nr:hypothetical protein [Chitinophagaceae bacterium]
MDRKIFTIVLAVALLGCFFLPYFSFFGMSVSGFDMVKAPGGGWQKYILLLIPLAGILLLVGAVNNENYPLARNILCWLPLLAIIFILILSPLIDGRAIGDIFSAIGKGYGIGLWITIAASVALVAYTPKAKA